MQSLPQFERAAPLVCYPEQVQQPEHAMFHLADLTACTAHTHAEAGVTYRGDLPTYTVVTTSVCPLGVVAFTLMEFSRTVMIGAVVSAATGVEVAHSEAAVRHTPSVEHLHHSPSHRSLLRCADG